MAPLMDITRKVVFNLGRYEQMEVTITLKDVPTDLESGVVADTIDVLMAPEIARAAFATVHPEEDNATSVYSWRRIAEEGMNA